MEAWGLTDTGNVREENQDFYRMERLGPETLLAVVCDGMGGARAGNVASRLACEVFCGEVCRSLRDGMTEAEEQDVLWHGRRSWPIFLSMSMHSSARSSAAWARRSWLPSSAACAWRS